jgi:formylglycine-generating enzyme required for sulfatase activity
MTFRRWLWFAVALAVGCGAPPGPPATNEPPVAEAGPNQAVLVHQSVRLDGSASRDPEGRELNYRWTGDAANPAPVATGAGLASWTFVPTVTGTYWFHLVVNDGEQDSQPDSVRVVVRTTNTAPIANAGPDLVFAAGGTVPLSGAGSYDPDGDALTYSWQVVQSPVNVVVDGANAARASVSLTTAGDYRFRLQVSDGQATTQDEVTITISAAADQPPIARAGADQQVSVGSLVTLDGSGSYDPEGQALTYRWSVGRTPDGHLLLSDSLAVRPTFTANQAGEYVFALVVGAGGAVSLQDVVTVTASSGGYPQHNGMTQVPAGAFNMGSAEGSADEQPVHHVELASFWIDQREVTAGQYQACVDAKGCTAAGQSANCNAGRTDRTDHPANCVSWAQAQAYCVWAGKRLPTEAEWEFAARGLDNRRFAWGQEYPDPSRMNYGNFIGATTPVGDFPLDVSFYGLFDMGGNVHEWTADYYDPGFYGVSPVANPTGPAAGAYRVGRGASWRVGFPVEALTATVRQAFVPETRDNALGFRCVQP